VRRCLGTQGHYSTISQSGTTPPKCGVALPRSAFHKTDLTTSLFIRLFWHLGKLMIISSYDGKRIEI
jgi:hypothetical protein